MTLAMTKDKQHVITNVKLLAAMFSDAVTPTDEAG